MRRFACLAVIALAAVPQAASATTYCAYDTACEAAGGTHANNVQHGLDLAQSHVGPDRVEIGPNPCPACKFSGGSYSSSDPLEIVGAGQASTTLSISSPVLSLGTSSSVSVFDLTIVVPAGSGSRGLSLTGARAARVDVVAEPGAVGSTAVTLLNGGSFRNGRVWLSADAVGISAGYGSNSVDSALVRLVAASATGLLVESPATADVTLNARHVTVVGTGASTQGGAALNATAADETAALNLRNSIIHAVGHALRRTASAVATAQIATDYSSYDPSGNISTGSGGIAAQNAASPDPGLMDEGAGDFRLGAGSALIDAGESGGLSGVESPQDLNGNPRVLNGDSDCVPRRDVGAYEFVASSVFTSVASPATALIGQPVTFNGSTSCDPDPAATLSYSWSFDDGSSGSGPTIQHAFANPGNHTAALTVTSSSGRSGSTAASVRVVLPAPAIGSTKAPPPAPFSRTRLRPPVLIARRAIPVSQQGVAKIPLECAGPVRCVGRIALVTTRPVSLTNRKRVQKLGSARFSIPAGRTTRVKVRLSKIELRLVRRLRRLAARATVTDRDSAGRTRKVTRTVVLRAR